MIGMGLGMKFIENLVNLNVIWMEFLFNGEKILNFFVIIFIKYIFLY